MMFDLVITLLAAASALSSEAANNAAEASATEATATEMPAAPPQGEQPAVKPKKICKTLPGATGSRMGNKRVCATAEEWKKYYSEQDPVRR